MRIIRWISFVLGCALLLVLYSCTVNYTSDIERFARIERRLDKKADTASVQQALNQVSDEVVKNRQAAADARAAAVKGAK